MRIGLPILEDSSLIFARRVGDAMAQRGWEPVYVHVQERHVDGSKLSERQVDEALGPNGLDASVTERNFMGDDFLANFQAVVFARSFREMRARMRREAFRRRADRPRFVAFMPGLEFTPERGIEGRLWFDAVFLNHPDDRDLFLSGARRGERQIVDWGHPYFLRPGARRAAAADAPVYFFPQAISPRTLGARLHVLHAMHVIARLHPRRRVVIKLRHLPDENEKHVHRELFAYPWLQSRHCPPAPPNVAFEIGPIAPALAEAGMAITCTSTAAMDAISAGAPTQVYLDFPEFYRDPLVEPMRRLFRDSGAIARLGDILALRAPPPPPDAWLARNFREETALYDALEAAIVPTRRQTAA